MQKPVRKLIVSVAALVVAICLLVGAGLAWFSTNRAADVERFGVSSESKEISVKLEVKRSLGLLDAATGERGETIVPIESMTFTDVQYGETYTFTLTLETATATAKPVTITLEGISAQVFGYYNSTDNVLRYTTLGGLFRCDTLAGDLTNAAQLGYLTEREMTGVAAGDPFTTSKTIVDAATWTPVADPSSGKMTATVAFTLKYGNWIDADESKQVISSGNLTIGKLVVRSA